MYRNTWTTSAHKKPFSLQSLRGYLTDNGVFLGMTLITMGAFWFMDTWGYLRTGQDHSSLTLFTSVLSVTIYQWIQTLLGTGGVLLLFEVLFPGLQFYLLLRLFYVYLPRSYSVLLSFLSVSYVQGYPLRFFVWDLWNPGFQASPDLPVITGMPSLSMVLFLLILTRAIQPTIALSLRSVSITIAWSVFIFLSATDALIGCILWFSILCIRLWRQKGDVYQKGVFFTLNMALFACTFLIALWYLPKAASPLYWDVSTLMHIILVYYVLPVCLMFVIYRLGKVDPYEVSIKFSYIYVLMVLEILFLCVSTLFQVPGAEDFFFYKSPVFLLHFLYYVPPLYYVSKYPQKWISRVLWAMIWVGIGLSIAYMITNSYRYYHMTYL